MRRSVVAGSLAVVLLAAGCTKDPGPSPAPSASPFTAGADGAGDAYYPTHGNGGYDVGGYDLALRYDPKSAQLTGTATITATATQNLSRFNLDLDRLTVRSAQVDGQRAGFAQRNGELTITPAAGLESGKRFTVVVDYGGEPGRIGDKELGEGGWLRTSDGAIALGQPESASTWFPVNDHPSDKATFALAMTVPDGVEALSIGVPGERTSAGGWTTWRWSEAAPMASYLSTVVIGQYRVTTTTHQGKPMVVAVADALGSNGADARSVARTGEIADFLATKFGAYPFGSYGGIVVADPQINYALETQSRPVYGRSFFARGPNEGVVAHELAHQWFGDSVALDRWQDIWLNEGFATYAEWLWTEHEGGLTVAQSFDRVYAGYAWTELAGKAGDPGTSKLFGDAVYQRGGMTVYALRRTIGDAAFDRLLRQWTGTHRDGNATTDDLIAMAEQISGKDLDAFFQSWLFTTAKPPKP